MKPAKLPSQDFTSNDFGLNFGADFLILMKRFAPYISAHPSVNLHNSAVEHMQLAAREAIYSADHAALALQETHKHLAEAVIKFAQQLQAEMVDAVNGISPILDSSTINFGTEFNNLFPDLRPLEKDQRIHMFACGLRHLQLYARESLQSAPDVVSALEFIDPELSHLVALHAQKIQERIVSTVSLLDQNCSHQAVINSANLGQAFIDTTKQINSYDADTRVHLFACALRHVQLTTLSAVQTAHEAADALKTSNPELSKAILDHANQLYATICQAIAQIPVKK